MAESRTKNASRNIVWGLIENIVAILLPFLIRTFLIKSLGAEYLGLSGLFTSVLQVLNISELGLGSAIVFSMYKPIAENDNAKVCAMLNLYRKIYLIIGTIILIVGLLILPFLDVLIKGDIPNDINIYYLYLMYLGNTVVSFYLFAYKSALFSAFQRNDIISKRNTCISFLVGLLQIFFIYLFRNYYLYVLMILLGTISTNIINAYYANIMYPDIVCKGSISKEDKSELKKRVIGLLSYKIYSVIYTSVDIIVVSSFLGLVNLAVFNNYFYIQVAITRFLSVISSSITAGVGNKMITNTANDNYSDFINIVFARGWLVSWCSICLLCLYQSFMTIWVGNKLMFTIDTVILLVIQFYVSQIANVTYTYREAAGLWWEDRYRPLISTLMNISLNILLVNYIGINGVVISTVLCSTLINIPWGTFVLFSKYFKRSAMEYYKNLFYYSIITLLTGIVTYYCCELINIQGVGELIFKFALCLLIPNIIFTIIYNNCLEFHFVKDRIKRIIHL